MREERFQQLRIRTPEGIVFSQRIAGPFSRFAAWSIDVVLVMAVQTLLVTQLRVVGIISPEAYNIVALISIFVLMVGYGMFFEWRMNGQTPGKRMLGLRVIDDRGLRLRFPQVVVRNLLRVLDSFPFGYVTGGLVALIHPRCQRIGDLAAGTLVAARPVRFTPDIDALEGDRHNSFRKFPHLEGRLRQLLLPEEQRLLMDAVMRRSQMDPETRLGLYRELADHFRPLAGFPPELTDELSDEQFLRNLVDSLFRRVQTE